MSSIVGLALRMSAVRALAGATLAEDRVYDSAILPIADLVSAEPKPYVSISTDDEEATPSGRDLNNGEREIDLVIEIAMASAASVPAKDGDGDLIQVTVPETDSGLEVALAILCRQIMVCLFGRGGGAYGDAFRALTASVKKITSRRGAESKQGVRYAARQITMTIQAIAEPPLAGGALNEQSPLAAFLAALEADSAEQIEPLWRGIRQAIEGEPVGWPEVYTAGAVLAGYTEAEGRFLGIGVLAPIEADGDTDVLTEVVIDPDGWVGNEETVEEQVPDE